MKAAALIVAAGQGLRAGPGAPKQYRLLGDRPVLAWSVDAFAALSGPIVLVIRPGDEPQALEAAGPVPVALAHGGETRTCSVRAGLDALTRSAPDAVLIHDAARPGVTPEIIAAVLDGLETADATAPALKVVDALKRADPDGYVLSEAPREGLWRIQTPQGFRFAEITAAYQALAPGQAYDDDFAVARAFGLRTRLVAGAETLTKITYPEDYDMIMRLLGGSPPTPCVGTGFDAHRFGPGDHVTLCGVRIPHERGLIGHSDADCAWHALTDAILGALGEGDIGDHFPPSDPQWKGAASETFLAHALSLAKKRKARLMHVDVTLLCERPKVKPHRDAMRRRTAEVLGLSMDRVSVKATTTERLGFLGREEGLAAQAVATLLVR